MSGLKDFRNFFASFLSIVGAGVAATALVLVTALVGLAPPWPPAIVQITAIAQLLVLVFVFQNLKSAARRTVNSRMKLSLVLMVVFSISYLGLHSLLYFDRPDGTGALRGMACSPDALSIYGSSCPFLERMQIADAEFEADRLWTPLGLLASRLSILVLWVGAFSALVNIFAAFVVFQRRQTR